VSGLVEATGYVRKKNAEGLLRGLSGLSALDGH
jgi:hypothetical protein